MSIFYCKRTNTSQVTKICSFVYNVADSVNNFFSCQITSNSRVKVSANKRRNHLPSHSIRKNHFYSILIRSELSSNSAWCNNIVTLYLCISNKNISIFGILAFSFYIMFQLTIGISLQRTTTTTI